MSFIARRSWSSSRASAPKWTAPVGRDTGIKIYNGVTREKVPLVVPAERAASWYSCGPTVYAAAHVGHASCYVRLDVVRRLLEAFGARLVVAMGVTDVDDKIVAAAANARESVGEVARRHEAAFWRDLDALGVLPPHLKLRVTDHIGAVRRFVDRLFELGACYGADDGSVYFDTSRSVGYGIFRPGAEETAAAAAREEDAGKRSAADFALWKGRGESETRWPARWGAGRPGWHIECSAMASEAFGARVNFHAGGTDLRFPHHENEEAQCRSYHGSSQWVDYWLHAGHLRLRGDKMSKSLRNGVSVPEMLERHGAETFRTACLLSHYRGEMEYDDESFRAARGALDGMREFVGRLEQTLELASRADEPHDDGDFFLLGELERTRADVDTFLRDDFRTAAAVAALRRLSTVVNKRLDYRSRGAHPFVLACLLEFATGTMETFGLKPLGPRTESEVDRSDVVDLLVNFRNEVRLDSLSSKNYRLLKLCDSVRGKLLEKNIKVKDDSINKISSWITLSS